MLCSSDHLSLYSSLLMHLPCTALRCIPPPATTVQQYRIHVCVVLGSGGLEWLKMPNKLQRLLSFCDIYACATDYWVSDYWTLGRDVASLHVYREQLIFTSEYIRYIWLLYHWTDKPCTDNIQLVNISFPHKFMGKRAFSGSFGTIENITKICHKILNNLNKESKIQNHECVLYIQE